MKQLFENTTTVAGSTTRVSDAAGQFAQAGAQLSQTVERFRQELPRQQSELVNQVHELVASERQAALSQATTQVADLRTTTIEQLNSSLNMRLAQNIFAPICSRTRMQPGCVHGLEATWISAFSFMWHMTNVTFSKSMPTRRSSRQIYGPRFSVPPGLNRRLSSPWLFRA